MRCPSSIGIVGEILPDCCTGVGLVIPTCKGLKESSNELLRPFVSSVSIQNERIFKKRYLYSKVIFVKKNLQRLNKCYLKY